MVPIEGIASISAGGSHASALTDTGGVKCWGDNSNGQLGNNATVTQSVPVDVVGLTSGVSAISAGQRHTCALTNLGGVKCWGGNDSGQLGNDTQQDQLTPVDVSGLASGASAVATGGQHTCALTTSGGVKCWGSNNAGQLGNDTNTPSLVPTDVTGLESGVAAVATGDAYACAVTAGGGLRCWGSNGSGQLGNDSTLNQLLPVDVVGMQPDPGARWGQQNPHMTMLLRENPVVRY